MLYTILIFLGFGTTRMDALMLQVLENQNTETPNNATGVQAHGDIFAGSLVVIMHQSEPVGLLVATVFIALLCLIVICVGLAVLWIHRDRQQELNSQFHSIEGLENPHYRGGIAPPIPGHHNDADEVEVPPEPPAEDPYVVDGERNVPMVKELQVNPIAAVPARRRRGRAEVDPSSSRRITRSMTSGRSRE